MVMVVEVEVVMRVRRSVLRRNVARESIELDSLDVGENNFFVRACHA